MEFSTETSSRKKTKKLTVFSENILVKDDQVKLADFGSCRGVYSQPPFTEYISTRWYRPPECLLTDGYYNHKMDYWGVGCVFFEVLALFPLFPGNDELD
jgi:renal tumor antigen